MKNINVCLLAAVACTYSLQVAANSLEHNLNSVIEDNVYSLRNSSAASHTVTPLELEPILASNSGIKLAAICALAGGGCDDIDFNLDEAAQCKDEGFGFNICNSVQIAGELCPYDSNYNRGCSCKPGLVSCNSAQDGVGESCSSKYASCVCKSSLVSCSDSQDGVGDSCGGKYASCNCKLGLVTCNEVQSGVGTVCSGKYTSCNCKSTLISCTANQIGIGTSCGGKYSSCNCPASWTTCSETGGASGALVCTTAGGTRYYNNCRPKDDNCPSGYTKSACNGSTPIETGRKTTEAGSTCYVCRARTCVEENQRCPIGTWNLDFYYANQALKCLIK